ncbi:MAG TPA: 50S ribosomal protein L13 [Candidatus Dojkabacteria bacterium]|nr:50S ribosomal protein L13 [Candidatus Dojkabacteria bacterium]HQF36615.1 50S ribosomal protein L13 [Candidatus Dojkabacteria bacterium]
MRRIDQKTTFIKGEEISRDWYVIDASKIELGRLASVVVFYLMGKNKAKYAGDSNIGNCVIVTNAEKIKLSSEGKLDKKKFQSHSMYPKGFKEVSLRYLMNKSHKKVIESAVLGMLPKNKLRDRYMSKLHIVEGVEHKYVAQKPVEIKL